MGLTTSWTAVSWRKVPPSAHPRGRGKNVVGQPLRASRGRKTALGAGASLEAAMAMALASTAMARTPWNPRATMDSPKGAWRRRMPP